MFWRVLTCSPFFPLSVNQAYLVKEICFDIFVTVFNCHFQFKQPNQSSCSLKWPIISLGSSRPSGLVWLWLRWLSVLAHSSSIFQLVPTYRLAHVGLRFCGLSWLLFASRLVLSLSWIISAVRCDSVYCILPKFSLGLIVLSITCVDSKRC
jgi:hypothetical protein